MAGAQEMRTTAPAMGSSSGLEAVLAMMQVTDSAIPTGAFSHSLGFETYISRGELETAEQFAAWLEMFVAQQLTFTDALAIRLVHAATSFDELAGLDDLVTAQALPRQVREGQATMGRRLLTIGATEFGSAWVQRYHDEVMAGRLHGHPALVFGLLSRSFGLGVDEAVAQHLFATVISLTQNAVRAIPLGQNAGQRIQRQAQAWVLGAVDSSSRLEADDLGAIAPGLEIAQMQHEHQRARLFMS